MTTQDNDNKKEEAGDGEKTNVWDAWLDEAKQVTPETLSKFIDKLIAVEHSYDSITAACAAAAVAAFHAVNNSPQGNITVFQASWAAWTATGRILGWEQDSIGRRLLNFDMLLYPQYESDFEKTITSKQAVHLKEKAQKLLNTAAADDGFASAEVRAHWMRVAEGHIPFGFTISDRL